MWLPEEKSRWAERREQDEYSKWFFAETAERNGQKYRTAETEKPPECFSSRAFKDVDGSDRTGRISSAGNHICDSDACAGKEILWSGERKKWCSWPLWKEGGCIFFFAGKRCAPRDVYPTKREKDKVAVIRIQGKRRCRNCFPDPEGVGCKGENAAGSSCYGTGRWVEKRVRGGLPATGRSNERRKWIYFHSFFSQDKGKGRASECSRLHSSFHWFQWPGKLLRNAGTVFSSADRKQSRLESNRGLLRLWNFRNGQG